MHIIFWKMHGAGNDFILIDDRSEKLPCLHSAWLKHLCCRRTGIGADGLILIQSSKSEDFRIRFFNSDGNEVEMCGNGARCVARLAYDLDIAQQQMTAETAAGVIRAELVTDPVCAVRLWLPPPSNWRLNQSLELHGQCLNYHFINTGVPHIVMEVEHLDKMDVQGVGADIRYHEAFVPMGANVNFFTVAGPHSLKVRTYERGVEAETSACGTGIMACALVAGRLVKVAPPVQVTCAHGDDLEVNYKLTSEGAEQVSLCGPAVHVFKGTIEYKEKSQ